jgi:hypothetical protein
MNGVPIICSDYGPYHDYQGVAQRARTAGDWFQLISFLIEEEVDRAGLAMGNLSAIREKYTEDAILPEWEAAWLGENTAIIPAGTYDDAESRAMLEHAIGS